MPLPEGYYLGKVKFAGKYIFEEGTNKKVSMNYHEFNYPKVKLGANHYNLIKHKGYFIPRDRPSHMSSKEEADKKAKRSQGPDETSRFPGATQEEFKILKVIAEYHGISPPDKSIIEKNTPQQILRDALDNDDDDDGWNDYRVK